MRVFDHPNTGSGWKCPVCQTDEDKPVTLIAIDGTQRGNIVEAEQFHLDCIELTWSRHNNVIVMLAVIKGGG